MVIQAFTARNLSSANTYPKVLFDNILAELQERRVAGPFVHPPLPNFRTSPVGVIPKKESSKFRTITDLSSPQGISVNDFIADSESSVSFHHFDEAVRIVAKLGKGASLAKLDVKSAFRICPVRHEDWHLLGFTFQNLFFVDLCLPFGLRSSVNRFSRLADLVLWIMQNNYSIIHSTHYLDHAGSDECNQALATSISLFRRLGIPLAPSKIVGPCKVIVYLGIEIDSEAMELRLPQEKLVSLLHLIRTFEGKTKGNVPKKICYLWKIIVRFEGHSIRQNFHSPPDTPFNNCEQAVSPYFVKFCSKGRLMVVELIFAIMERQVQNFRALFDSGLKPRLEPRTPI